MEDILDVSKTWSWIVLHVFHFLTCYVWAVLALKTINLNICIPRQMRGRCSHLDHLFQTLFHSCRLNYARNFYSDEVRNLEWTIFSHWKGVLSVISIEISVWINRYTHIFRKLPLSFSSYFFIVPFFLACLKGLYYMIFFFIPRFIIKNNSVFKSNNSTP